MKIIFKTLLITIFLIEYLFAESFNDALKRAIEYSKAGSDLIMIHSKENNPKKIFEFSRKFLKTKYAKPLVAVPSTYSKTPEKVLIRNGFKIVIYANHLLRSSYFAMYQNAEKILRSKRSFEAEKQMTSIKDIISLIK